MHCCIKQNSKFWKGVLYMATLCGIKPAKNLVCLPFGSLDLEFKCGN